MSTRRKNNEPANLIGGIAIDPNLDFKRNIEGIFESMRHNHRVNAWEDIKTIAQDGEMREFYKEELLKDVIESASTDEYFDRHAEMLGQMFDNSMTQIVNESQAATAMLPVVGLTPPMLKKNYFDNIGKDIMDTVVGDKPLIRLEFERQYLLGEDMKTKYYVPDIYQNGKWKELYKDMRGIEIPAKIVEYNNGSAPQAGQQAAHVLVPGNNGLKLPLFNFDLFEITGASVKKDDNIGLDFCVSGVEATVALNPAFVDADGVSHSTQTFVKTNMELIPDYAHRGVINFDVRFKDWNGKEHADKVFVTVDPVAGTITANSAAGIVTLVKFGGHIANKNNERSVTLRSEVEEREFSIADGERINMNLTVEDLTDMNALNDIDMTAKAVVDMTTTLTQIEDVRIIDFLNNSFENWQTSTPEDLPFGYGDHMLKGSFTEEAKFSVIPPSGPSVTQSNWIASELKFNIERLIDELTSKFDNKDASDISFSIYGHPKNIRLLSPEITWLVDSDTKVAGMKAAYTYGFMTSNGIKIRVVSTKKVAPSLGFGFVSIPLVKDVVTFKNVKYSLNIENSYRNPQAQLTPNIMATQRYKTLEVLAIQGRMKLVNNTFGNSNPMDVVTEEPGYLI